MQLKITDLKRNYYSYYLKLMLVLPMIVWVLLIFPHTVFSQPDEQSVREDRPPTMEELLKWKEEFTFNVKYTFLKVGTVEIEPVSDTLYRGYRAWHFKARIKSSGIPLVGKEENHYNSIFYVHDGIPRELAYWMDNVDEGALEEERFEYYYDRREVISFKEGEPTDTLDIELPATSGPMIFYYSRLKSGLNDTTRVYAYLEDDSGVIDLWFTSQKEDRGYDAFEDDITTLFAEGDTDINGPFGFSGRFRFWHAGDPLRIPVESRLKVWLGNVKVKLEEYKRNPRDE